MRHVRIILALVLLALFTLIIVQNTEVVAVRFFAWEFSMSRILLLLLTLLIGFVLGYLAARIGTLRKAAAA